MFGEKAVPTPDNSREKMQDRIVKRRPNLKIEEKRMSFVIKDLQIQYNVDLNFQFNSVGFIGMTLYMYFYSATTTMKRNKEDS